MSSRHAADVATRASLQAAFWIPLGICTWLALTPAPPDAIENVSDVALHAFAFTYLAFALGLAMPRLRLRWIAVALFGYGAGLEVLQGLGSARVASFQDLVVDVLGITLGLLLLRGLGDWSRRTVRTVWRVLLPS
jgi:VanZ family protein